MTEPLINPPNANSTHTTPSLHAQAPTERFSDRAQDYANYRPSYPAIAIDTILDGLSHPTQLNIADIGAGTGIASRLIAEREVRVQAIEPNAAMQQAADPHPGITWHQTTAEQTGLPEQSVDLVLCCQSFHWFDQLVALQEFHRILKPSGRVVLMRNDRNLDDPFTQAYSDVVRQVADRQIFDHIDRKSATPLENSLHFTHFRTHCFSHTHRLSLNGLTGLALSSSYTPKSGTACEQLMANLQTLYNHWMTPAQGDFVLLSYHVNLYMVDRNTAP